MGRPYKGKDYLLRESDWPLMLRLKGTVMLRIWWQILLVGVYSTGVWAIHEFSNWKLNYGQTLISVLGVVTGLLLVFRTNTAYDRYWEGRRLWSTMTLAIRTMTRTIWVGVKENETRDLIEKKSAINLLVAFAYATKHYLRGEYNPTYNDMADLLSIIPKYHVPSSTEPMADWLEDARIRSSDNHSQRQQPNGLASSVSDYGHTDKIQPEPTRHRRDRAQALAFDVIAPTNIPIELTYYIASYIQDVQDTDRLGAAQLSVMNTALGTLVEALTNFERILRTPIPLAYSIHLHHATWLYVLALPFQLAATMGAFMILAVMLASFTLLGILGIGYEIENPFNDDYNDLPLDDFCRVIQAEVEAMVKYRPPLPEKWKYLESRPLRPVSDLTADELTKMSLNEVHEMLAAKQANESKSKSNTSDTKATTNKIETSVVNIPPETSTGTKEKHA